MVCTFLFGILLISYSVLAEFQQNIDRWQAVDDSPYYDDFNEEILSMMSPLALWKRGGSMQAQLSNDMSRYINEPIKRAEALIRTGFYRKARWRCIYDCKKSIPIHVWRPFWQCVTKCIQQKERNYIRHLKKLHRINGNPGIVEIEEEEKPTEIIHSPVQLLDSFLAKMKSENDKQKQTMIQLPKNKSDIIKSGDE
ncbi:hypothetical protein SNEBB_004066 [Seison nebaliae]|nr:hypothetical protein SNEBB_004066 [Seison nebaliae]